MKPTKTIKLNSKLISVITEFVNNAKTLQDSIKEPQERINAINNQLTSMLIALCLSEDVDLNTTKVTLSENMTELLVFPKDDVEIEIEEKPVKKATTKKM